MNNDPKSAKPNASYINGRAYDGKTPLKQKPASRPASALRDGTGRAHEQKSASHADPARRTPASSERAHSETHRTGTHSGHSSSGGSSHRSSSHHRSRSKKKKVVKNVLKNYGLTAAAIVGVIVIIAVIVIFSSGGGKYQEGEVHETQTSNYDNLVIDSDLVELTDEEAKSAVVLPASSRYFEDGRPDIVIERDAAGALIGAKYYGYLEDGKQISEKAYGPSGKLEGKTVYTSTENGCVKSVFTINADKNGAYEGYTLDDVDAEGVIKKSTVYTYTGVVDHYTYFEYNEKGLVNRETVYSAYNIITAFNEYLYDDAGRKTDMFMYDANNVPTARTSWEYDELDRVVKESYFLKDVCRTYSEFEYREDGSYIMTNYTLVDENTMTYDKKIMND